MGKKVNLNSVTDLRNATDLALPTIFTQLGYEQSFTHSDIKLGLGLVTVAIACGLYYLEKNYAFKDTFYVIVASIILYGVVSAVMYYLSNGSKYKNVKYVGKKDKNEKVSVSTSSKPFDPIYEVKVVFNDNYSGAIRKEISFNKFFDAFGFLNEEELKKILAEVLEKKAQ